MTAPWYLDGRLHFGLGIEDTFVPQAADGERPLDEYELTEHYEHAAGDFALAARAGAEFLRWGIPWYRVQPAPGEWRWQWVDRAMDSLEEVGLRPVLDLLHYGTPLWLADQFVNPDFPARFTEFADAVAERYAGRVHDFTPVNEPVIHALFCGEYGYWPPYLTGEDGFTRVAVQLAKASAAAQHAIGDRLGAAATFVHVEAAMAFVGDGEAPEHRAEAARLRGQVLLAEDLVCGLVGDEHPLLPQLRRAGIDDETLAWFRGHPAPPDVMGVNYYPRTSTEVFEPGVRHRGGFSDPRPSLDRGLDGLREALGSFHARYGVPVMITETAVTGSVGDRLAWMDASVGLADELVSSGFPLVGYTWWPLFDMYEWTWRHSERRRADHLLAMGLFDLVESSAGLARVRNPVAERYRSLAIRRTTGVLDPST